MRITTQEQVFEHFPNLHGRTEVELDEHRYDLADLWLRFARHEIGEHQATQEPRFHKSFPLGDHGYAGHIALIGPDAHPTIHMPHTTSEIVIPALEIQPTNQSLPNFTPEEQALLVVASIIHDIDEAEHPLVETVMNFVVGDVPAINVTKDDELKKEKIRRQFMYPRFFGDFSEKLVDKVEEIITHKEGVFAAEAFYYMEVLGYFMTGQKAAQIAIAHADTDPELSETAASLAQAVLKWNKKDIERGSNTLELFRKRIGPILKDIDKTAMVTSNS